MDVETCNLLRSQGLVGNAAASALANTSKGSKYDLCGIKYSTDNAHVTTTEYR